MRQPRKWLAVLLSVFSPGLGHLYCGRFLASVAIVVTLELASIPATISIQSAPLATLVVMVVFVLAYIVAVAMHAARVSEEPTEHLATKFRMAGAVLMFLVLSGVVGEALRDLRNQHLGEPFRIPAASMLPTLQIGDHFYSDARAYHNAAPERGDIIIFKVARDGSAVFPADHRPDLPTEDFVKRVVGVPGDTVELNGATLTVNGVQVTGRPTAGTLEDPNGRQLVVRPESLGSHHFQVLDDPDRSSTSAIVVVEPGRYFVSGDNRLHSNDSRYWGTIRREDIIGEVTKIYWSWNFNGSAALLFNPFEWARLLRSETRWDRLGLTPS
jgi:signal peptidase I